MAELLTGMSGAASTFINIALIFIAIIVIVGLFGGITWLILDNKRYSQFKVRVWQKDLWGQIIDTTDRAGIFVDRKTNNKRLFIKKGKVGLDCDSIPYTTNEKGQKIIYLYKFGEKNYSFLKPQIDKDKNWFVMKVTEEDINWGINAYERSKKLFATNGLLQYMPYIALAFVAIVILVIFIYFFREFGTLQQTGEALRDAAIALKDYRSNMTILP